MAILHTIINWVSKKRLHDIDLFVKHPIEVQQDVLNDLLEKGKNTSYGEQFQFNKIESLKDFQAQIPLSKYEQLYPWIDRVLKGENHVLWPGNTKWFAKSSGTTNAKSKFIPMSKESLEDCHYKGGKDLIAIYLRNFENSKMFKGKGLGIGGSQQVSNEFTNKDFACGDVSYVIIKNLPLWAQYARTPSLDIALMADWEKKIDAMAKATMHENVTSISGVPTWTLLLLERLLEMTGKKDIREIWPNLEVFVHGAVAFDPYQSLFNKLIPHDDMFYMDTFNASEGFFGIQDQTDSKDMLLMLDYGIFYEFIPLEESHEEHPKVLQLEDVEVGKNYEMVITTNAGLWRYRIGDTVRFTSLSPFRIRVSGRTKHFINAFGEELIIENADQAIIAACKATQASIEEYTAGPSYLDHGKQGAHEWIIEFYKTPNDLDLFRQVLDITLRQVNSDYDAKRTGDLALVAPIVQVAPKGTFYSWMESKGKLGGQNKVPRLSNDRNYLTEIHALVQKKMGGYDRSASI